VPIPCLMGTWPLPRFALTVFALVKKASSGMTDIPLLVMNRSSLMITCLVYHSQHSGSYTDHVLEIRRCNVFS
jgi:hypothetical protein